MRFAHVGISVANQVRSRRFYERHFGFDPDQARSYPDGTLILRDADGFVLALHRAMGRRMMSSSISGTPAPMLNRFARCGKDCSRPAKL
jgi:catechol 2,3-dioxygenase-like lactoylglutathione lyase family enzyme